MEKFITKDGQLEKVEVVVSGRKFPLHGLRKAFLSDHKPYMRLNTDEEINDMALDSLQNITSHYCDKVETSLRTSCATTSSKSNDHDHSFYGTITVQFLD